jgi:protein gp37
MGADSAIQWTDHTFNIAWGCEQISPGCDNCYAKAWAKRTGLEVWGPDAPRRTFGEKHWSAPLGWNERAKKAGRIERVFCSSMADVFEDHPTIEVQRARLWSLIVATPHLRWMLLTKRPENIERMTSSDVALEAIGRSWVGVTAETQEYYDRRWPILARVPAARRFVSNEPALGPLTLICEGCGGTTGDHMTPDQGGCSAWFPDWVITGGESGGGARPYDVAWGQDLHGQCEGTRIAFLWKQLGARPVLNGVPLKLRDKHGGDWDEWPADVPRVRQWPKESGGAA